MATVIDRRISFNGGELSPWVDPRVDLDKYRTGCSELRNFRPNVYGGAFRRPGTLYIGEVDDSTKNTILVKFEFSVTTTLILEFGDLYIRIWTTGDSPELVEDPFSEGNPYKITTPWTADQIGQLQFAQINDQIYIAHDLTRPRVLTRIANNDWSLAPLAEEWPATFDDNITMIELNVSGGETPDTYPTWVASNYLVGDRVTYSGVDYECILRPGNNVQARTLAPGTYNNWQTFWVVVEPTVTYGLGQIITLESSEPFFQPGHVGSTFLIKHRRVDPTVSLPLQSTVGATSDPTMVLGDWTASIGVSQGGNWDITAAIQRSYDGVTWETIRSITSSGLVSDLITGTELEPCFLRMYILDTVGIAPNNAKFVLEPADSYHYGLLLVEAYTDSEEVDVRVVFPPYSDDPTVHWNEPAWSEYRGFPRTVAFHEGRLLWAGSRSRPQNVWGSVVDDYGNYRVSADDDGGLSFRLASDAANGIQWIVGQESLIIGTTGSEWVVGTRENQTTLTPSTIAAKRSTTYGSDLMQAMVVSDAVLFVQRNARKVREFTYTYESDGYTAQDLTLLSEHITDTGIVQIAVQKNPETVVWAITGNGDLVGVVYERGQNVAGWFRFDTGVRTGGRDYYESVAVVSGSGEEDEVWVCVRRVIDGETKRYIERFQPNIVRKLKDGDQVDLCYVDCAKIVTGSDLTSVSGLEHLEGRTVSVLSNGAPESNKVVEDGEITLDFPADTVVVGIPFESVLTPTYLETNDPASISRFSMKKVSEVVVELWRTNGFEATASGGEIWTPVDSREPDSYMDQAVPLYTGIFETLNLDSGSTRGAQVSVRQVQPLPLNVLSIYAKYDVNAT